jgi:hypothetical protein
VGVKTDFLPSTPDYKLKSKKVKTAPSPFFWKNNIANIG